jgi:hypothetical protein
VPDAAAREDSNSEDSNSEDSNNHR